MAFPESASRNFNIRGALSSVNENHYNSNEAAKSSADQPTVKAQKCPTFTGMGAD